MNSSVKKLAALTACTVCGTALLAALAEQVSGATFWDYNDQYTKLTWTIETEGVEIPFSGEATDVSGYEVTVSGEGLPEGGVELKYMEVGGYIDRWIGMDEVRYVFYEVEFLSDYDALHFGWGDFNEGLDWRKIQDGDLMLRPADTTAEVKVNEPTAIAALSLLSLGAVATRRQRRTTEGNK